MMKTLLAAVVVTAGMHAAVINFEDLGVAHASIIFTLGNNPQPGENNILLNTGTTGTSVQGTLNSFPNILVNFTSPDSLLEPANGQARVSANPEGSTLTRLSISLANGFTYGDLIINPFQGGPGVCALCTGGLATVTVNAISSSGVAEPVDASKTFQYTIGNGQNFLTIVAAGGESIVKTDIVITGGINDLRQPRISGPFSQVPEPGTCMLLISGLGLLGIVRKFRKA